MCSSSRVAQWKRAGPITQRSVDQNHALLTFANVQSRLSVCTFVACVHSLLYLFIEYATNAVQ